MPTDGEIGSDEWLKIINGLKTILPESVAFDFSGGEPLLKKDLLLRSIKILGGKFSKLVLNTNGYLLDETTIDQLIEAGLKEIKISLYSNDSKTHDFLRGMKGAHEHAVRAIELLKNKNITTELAILLTATNIASINEIIKRYSDYPRIRFNLQLLDEVYKNQLNNDWHDNYLPVNLWPTKEQFEDFLSSFVMSEKIKNKPAELRLIKNYYLNPDSALDFRCFSGIKNVVITPDGKISLCPKANPVGDITKNSLGQIIGSPAAQQARKNIKRCKKYCRIKGCNYFRGIKEILR